MARIIVDGLKQLNTQPKRDDISLDKNFIKLLLIGLVGVKVIKGQGVEKIIKKFVKELFQIRVETNVERMHSFEVLVHEATEEINRFKSNTK